MTAARRMRADQMLVERGLAESRTKAQALIMAGAVYAGTRRVAKPGETLPTESDLSVKGRGHPWVSRGGLKLEKGLAEFGIDPAGRVCLDIGASTGGFTDVLLHHGAARVYAVDVGHGQLAWTLRQHDQVVVLERTNARNLTADLVPQPVDIIVCDASFISLTKVLPAGMALAAPGARLVALIKPQFEVGRGQVGKGGVVRDPSQRAKVCRHIEDWLAAQPGWTVQGVTESPITGPEGNVEYLIAGSRDRAAA